MVDLQILRRLDANQTDEIRALVDAVEQSTGIRPLSDHLWLDLVAGGGDGFAGLLVRDPSSRSPIGYAQLSRGNDSWALELVLPPDEAGRRHVIEAALLDAAIEAAHDEPAPIHWWVQGAGAEEAALALRHGFRPRRVLLRMQRSLPIEDTAGVEVRPFEIGRDEGAWVAANNRAFADHPEQGGWTVESLRAREAEPWFDTRGFLLHERDDRLAAFCWTKIHPDIAPPAGEIYVIAVDPDFHGLGLGRALTVAGLEYLGRQGLTRGMLYVGEENAAAVSLYRSLGFEVERTDRAFVADPRDPR